MKKIILDIKSYLLNTDDFGFLNSSDGCYPIDLEFTFLDFNFNYMPLDKEGIPVMVYKSIGEQYNPTRIAAYALANFNRYKKTGSEDAKYEFLKMAEWFLSISDAQYKYYFDWQDIKAPWISCMAQGEAVSVLVRAFIETGDERFLNHAEKSLEPFLIDISEGGVCSLIENNYLFLEEYPSLKNKHVLNGFLYALIGLVEFIEVKPNSNLLKLRDELLNSLVKNIDSWGKYWSYYQIDKGRLIKNYCTVSYHNLQITQLKYLNCKYPSLALKKKIDDWEKGKKNILIRVFALFNKIVYRLVNRAQR